MKGIYLLHRRHLQWVGALFLVVLIVALSAPTSAQSGSYAISWWTIDGGGATLAGGTYALGGTIGQPDAALWSGGDYTLTGGFFGGVAAEYRLYLPLVVRP